LLVSGQKLWLVTDASATYLELMMKTTLGEDWSDFFGLKIARAKKPLF
jgi:hypothetical protein